MNNQLVCLEGTLSFEEDIRVQTLSFITFRTGQRISVTRESIEEGKAFLESVRLQLNNTEKAYTHVKIDKIKEMEEETSFLKVFEVAFSFLAAQNKRVWQVTFACQISPTEMMSFTSIYPDEASRINEVRRLRYCAQHFSTHAS